MQSGIETDLLHEEPLKQGFLAPDVELHGCRAFKRDCHTCCDPAECNEPRPPDFVPDAEPLPLCPRPSRKPT